MTDICRSDDVVVPWVISGADGNELRARAAALLAHVAADTDLVAVDLAASLVRVPPRGGHRAVVLGTRREAMLDGLRDLATGRPSALVVAGRSQPTGDVAIIFSGLGAGLSGTGQQAYSRYPAFARTFDAVENELERHLDRSLREVLWTRDDTLMGRTTWEHAALFALHVAQYRLLEDAGVAADHLVGHSLGETAAAHLAGVFSLADACRLLVLRARMVEAVRQSGVMVAVEASAEELEPFLGPRVSIAAVNTPSSLVIAGYPKAVDEVVAVFVAAGRRVKRLSASHAFHSPLMDSFLPELTDLVHSIPRADMTRSVVSSVTGASVTSAELRNAAYWTDNARGMVRFAESVRSLEELGVITLVELGVGGLLSPMVSANTSREILSVPLISSAGTEDLVVLTALARLYVAGLDVSLEAMLPDIPTRALSLPDAPTWSDSDLSTGLTATSSATGSGPLLDVVLDCTLAVLGHPQDTPLDPDRPFADLGAGSLAAMELRSRLSAEVGLTLPVSVVFDHPTPRLLAAHLRDRLEGASSAQGGPVGQRPARPDGDDPIVLVGMACRFPGGVTDPDGLWSLLREEVDAIGPFPLDRGWDLERLYDPELSRPGTSMTNQGGFLDDVAGFDAAFFGVSAREAVTMDPQQRLALQTAWESLENAGFDPRALTGEPVGVFVGVYSSGYRDTARRGGSDATGQVTVGTSGSMVSGRIAYALGLEGPAVSIDTACSSSLVALHNAALALRAGECRSAIAGGVTVMAEPDVFIGFSEMGGLSQDGRCRSFSDDADGTGWSEGVGMLVLERLSTARRHGRRVLAVLRGSAVNQDGASNGITAPRAVAQERVIRAALAASGLEPGDVDAVEAHGTGTRLGDPIEAEAVLATYGTRSTPGRPVYLGSLKSNLGHTQSAAGVCGVIKMILALRHELLPRSLHLDRPSSQVDWDRGGVALLTEAMPWPRGERPRRAGVSSFGISGTNAHVILEEAPHEPAATPTRVPGSAVAEPLPWLLSAAHPRALQAQAHRLGERLAADSALRVHDVGVTLLRGRSRHENRAVLLGPTRDSLVGGLRALAANRRHDQVVRGRATSSGTTAMLFAGQGAQRLGMGTALAARHPVFRQTFETVAAHFDGPLTEVVDGEDAAVLDRTEWAQPALFSFEVALARLAESYGLLPDHLLGHSIGEVAAAHVAGVFSLADACRLVHARGQLMQALPSGGAMVAIEATEAEVSPLLGERADLAAINTPHSLVVSGDEDAVVGIAEVFAERGRRTRRLPVSHAFHSHRMEPMLDAFKEALASITYHSPRIPLISCTTGRPVSEEVRSPAYWADHVRRTVRFADGLATLRADGATRFVELGPDAILSAFVDSDAQDIVAVPLLRGRQEDEPEAFTRALASLHAAGVEIDWSSRFPGDARLVELPTYPFQPRRYWPQAPVTAVADDDLIAALDRDDLAGAVELLRPRDSGEHAALVTALPLLVAWRHRRHATQDQHQHSDVEWRAVLSGDRPAEPLSGDPWLVLGRRRAVLEDALRRGGALVLDTVSDSTGVGNAGEPRADVARLAAVLAHAHGTTPLAGVLWAPSGHDLTELPALLRLLVAAPTAARLWVATTRAVRVPGDDQPPDPDAAMLWEAGRAAGLEHPTNWGGLVDFPATDDIDPARLAVLTDPNTSEVALRGAMVHVRRLPRGLVQEDGQPASGGGGRLVDQLAGLAAAEQEALLLDFLFEQFALVLGQSRADVVRPDTAFKDAGFDSLAVVELRDQLREVTGLKLPATVFFDHPTPLAFVRHLRDELAPDGVSPAAPVLDALAGLESPIGAAASEDDARDRIIKRLRELVKAAQAAAGQGASDDDLDAASDEELFALVDRSA